LLQNPIYTAVELADFARQADETEQGFIAEGGDTRELAKFISEGSRNMDDSGFFSVQVVSMALTVFGLTMVPIRSKEVEAIRGDPTLGEAYILNLRQHWLTIRRFGRFWFNLNSTLERPEVVSPTYLGVLLQQLQMDGYSVFVVQGELPHSEADDAAFVAATKCVCLLFCLFAFWWCPTCPDTRMMMIIMMMMQITARRSLSRLFGRGASGQWRRRSQRHPHRWITPKRNRRTTFASRGSRGLDSSEFHGTIVKEWMKGTVDLHLCGQHDISLFAVYFSRLVATSTMFLGDSKGSKMGKRVAVTPSLSSRKRRRSRRTRDSRTCDINARRVQQNARSPSSPVNFSPYAWSSSFVSR